MFKNLKAKNKIYFDIFTIEKGHNNMTYKGLPLRKCPFDYVIYQMIIFEVKPDLIIEIGTDKGGSALYMADLLDSMGRGMLHTIDIKDETNDLVKKHKRIKTFNEGWQKYDIKVTQKFDNILIIEDSTHFYNNTLAILRHFSSLISVGSYFIVEDGIIDELGLTKDFNGGPLKAINEFLSETNKFQIEKKWCNFFGENATFNVNGYLRKVC